MGQLGINAVKVLSFTAVGSLVGLINSITVARMAGVEELGRYSAMLSITLIALVPTQLGFPEFLVRTVSSAPPRHAVSTARSILQFAALKTLATALIVLAALYIVFVAIGPFAREGGLLATLAILLVVVPSINRHQALLRAMGEPATSQLFERVVRPALFLAAMLAGGVKFGFAERTAESVARALVVSYLVTYLILKIIVHRDFLRAAPPNGSIEADQIDRSGWLKGALALAAIGAAQSVNSNLDSICLSILSGDRDTGIYRVSMSVAGLAATALTATNVIGAPKFASFKQHSDRNKLTSAVDFLGLLSGAVSLVVALSLLRYGQLLITSLYGPDFSSSATPLLVLLFGQCVSVCFGPVALLLSMLGRARVVLITVITALLVNLVLNLALIPLYGAIGAAIATTTCVVVWNFVLWRFVLKELSVDVSLVASVNRTWRNRRQRIRHE